MNDAVAGFDICCHHIGLINRDGFFTSFNGYRIARGISLPNGVVVLFPKLLIKVC